MHIPCDRVPTLHCRETRRAAALVAALNDIVEDARVRVRDRVEESSAALSSVETLLVDECNDRAKRGRGSRGAEDKPECAVDGDHVVCSVRRNVREAAGLLAVVVLSRGVGRQVVLEVALDSARLVRWERENV